ncbi:MAG TPA: inositol monophosphatase family protein [Vicinamibacterales bacterium]|nr:inositol monophosphatase family protein [Vicinamibacterales bacterium]
MFLATAIEAVIRAGDVQMAHFGGEMRVDKKGAIDLVTEIDLRVEREFRAMIAERFPSHVVLGEEFSRDEDRTRVAEFCWILDPIDGTTNFAHGLPIFCCSLGLEINGELAVGAVFDPSRRELFTAQRGGGAWLNGAPLRVSSAATLLDSLLVTGFHYSIHKNPEELLGLFSEFITRARAVRRLGSAALDLCYVAAGRFDGFWEQKLQPWDVAAGALIVQEAGGTVTTSTGQPFQSSAGSVLATNGVIHAEMMDVIHGFSARFRSRNWTD